jgi:hypothetical protein
VTHLVECPNCGHERRVSNDRFGKKVKCTACENIFVSSVSEYLVERPTPLADKPGKGLMPKIAKMMVPDPSAAGEDCISGAISGILVGFLSAIVAGIVKGHAFGDIVGAVLFSFVIGFGVGAVLGALLGAAGRHVRPDFSIQRGYAPLVCGALIGTVVAILVENIYWAPLGAAFGAVGAYLWPLFCRRVDSVTALPSRPISEKDFLRDDREERAHHSSMGAR